MITRNLKHNLKTREMKKVILTVAILTGMVLTGCSNQERVRVEPEFDHLGRTNKIKKNERVFEIEVIDVRTGDTIVLHYTRNSARYTKAYKK